MSAPPIQVTISEAAGLVVMPDAVAGVGHRRKDLLAIEGLPWIARKQAKAIQSATLGLRAQLAQVKQRELHEATHAPRARD